MKKFSFIILIIFLNYALAGAEVMKFETINLDSGVKIKYLEKTHLPVVYVSVLIKASPLDETKPSEAYLTAHLLTHGTKNRSARQIEEEIDFLAISIEKKVTSDYTILTLSATKRHLQKALELFFDILKNPTFPIEELEREKSILYKNLKQFEEDPSYIAQKKLIKNIFGEHPYGRAVEGEAEKIKDVDKNDIIKFYERFYKPSNMLFSVIGDIDRNTLEQMIIKPLKEWQHEPHQRKLLPPSFEKREKPTKIYIQKEDLTQSTIIIGFEGISRTNPDFYAFSIMNYVLGGGGLTSRLAKNIREERGLAYSVYSIFYPYLFPGAFLIEVKTKADNTDRVIELIINELEKIKTHGITEEELKEAKSFLIGSFPLRVDTMKKLSEFVLITEFYGLGDDYFERYPEFINKVTKEEIGKVAERYINTDSYVLVIVSNLAP